MTVRIERAGDMEAIRRVHREAFHAEAEAKLVDALREAKVELVSLVAEVKREIVGHILFSPVTMGGEIKAMGLGFLGVLPDWQRRGVGIKLVNEGLKSCKRAGNEAVVVLGHPEYYPRFGFLPAAEFGITSEFDAPLEAFMVRELRKGALKVACGTVRYHEAFAGL